MLTDTTFWIDLLEERAARKSGGKPKPEPVHAFIARHRPHRFYVSIITWGELAEGFAVYDHLDFFLRGINVLPLPLQVAWAGSRIQRDLGADGQRLGENDAWIAATALTWGKRLITRDGRFKDVPRLSVVSY